MSHVFSVAATRATKQLVIALVLIAATISAIGQEAPKSTGSVHGSVVIIDANGPSYIPGAYVTLTGQVALQAQSDATGNFSFPMVPQGTYFITAQFTGVESKLETVEVKAGEVAELVLEVTPSEVRNSHKRSQSARQGREFAATGTRRGPRTRWAYQHERRSEHPKRCLG
jgi:hypothetical protein